MHHDEVVGGGGEEAVFVCGIDYVSAWREAHDAAQQLNDVAATLGLDGRFVRAVPHATATGEPVVWLRPEGVRLIADRLAALDERAGLEGEDGMARGQEWRTLSGARLWIESDRRGEFIRCEGCRRRILITGAGPGRFAADKHARTCDRR